MTSYDSNPIIDQMLQRLYTERADLLQREDEAKRDPSVLAFINERLQHRDENPTKTLAGVVASTLPVVVKIESLQAERKWVEQQILALLRNPALALTE